MSFCYCDSIRDLDSNLKGLENQVAHPRMMWDFLHSIKPMSGSQCDCTQSSGACFLASV